MASLLCSIRRPISRLCNNSIQFLSRSESKGPDGPRWVTIPCRFGFVVTQAPASGRARLPTYASPRLSLSPASRSAFVTPGYRLRLHRNPASGSHRLVPRRCYSESKKTGDRTNFQLKVRVAGGVLLLAAIFYISHLERVPQTGRWRFIGIPPEIEAEFEKEEHAALLKEYNGHILPPNHPITQQIRSVVSAILEANGLGALSSTPVPSQIQKGSETQNTNVELWDPDAERAVIDFVSDDSKLSNSPGSDTQREWNLIVVQDDSVVNAMAGSGNIIVFTGILPIAYDVDGLAAVLSHEIAHVVARHVAEKLSRTILIEGIYYILMLLGFDVGLGPMVMKYLYHLPNSRTMELEADKIGLQFASRACFDPRGAVSMQTRLDNLARRSGPRLDFAVLQTHPAGVTRIKDLTDSLPEAYALRAASSACAQLEDDFDGFRAMANDVRNEQGRELSA